jgi:competence protein ComEA
MSRKAGVIVAVLIIFALVIVFAAGRASMGLSALLRPPTIIIATPAPTPQPTTAASPALLHIYINGAVSVPGVYEFAPGALVDDALRAAGGFAPDADTRQLNLAQSLSNEMYIYVPSITEAGTAPPVIGLPVSTADLQLQRAGDTNTAGMININTAGYEELQELPGIGPALAQRIIDYRLENGPFANIAAIQDVAGIGPATFAELEPLITVDGLDAP